MLVLLGTYTLNTARAPGSTISFPYPSGTSQSTFVGDAAFAAGEVSINYNEVYREDDEEVAFTYGVSSISIENTSGVTWVAGSWITAVAAYSTGTTSPGEGGPANTLRSGEGPPSNSLGIDGDIYYDELNFFWYGTKRNGVWPAGFSLVPGEPGTGVNFLTIEQLDAAVNAGSLSSTAEYRITGTALRAVVIDATSSPQLVQIEGGSTEPYLFIDVLEGGIDGGDPAELVLEGGTA